MGAQVAKIAQVVGENQNFEGLKNAIQILIFVCRYMFLFLLAAILQNVLLAAAGSIILQIAFSMQVRTKVRPA